MELETFDFLNGLFSFIHVSVSIIIAFVLILKYYEHKNKTFLYVGLFLIGIAEPWISCSISFVLIILGQKALEAQLYVFLSVFLIPVLINFWLLAFTDLVYKEKQKLILSISIILNALYEIYFIYFVINDVSMIGQLTGYFDFQYRGIALLYMISVVFVASSTGVWFGKESLKSDKKDIKLKGKLLIIGFLCFFFGSMLDAILPLIEITLIIVRIIVISSSFFLYFGFLMPKFIRNLFKIS